MTRFTTDDVLRSKDRVAETIRERIEDAAAHAQTGRLKLAAHRLDLLERELAGSGTPGRGLLSAARIEMLRHRLRDRAAPPPDADTVRAVVDARIGGVDAGELVKGVIERAKATLAAAATDSAKIDSWREQLHGRLGRMTVGLLGDSEIAIANAVDHAAAENGL